MAPAGVLGAADATGTGVALGARVTGGAVDPLALHPVRVAAMSKVVPRAMRRAGRM